MRHVNVNARLQRNESDQGVVGDGKNGYALGNVLEEREIV